MSAEHLHPLALRQSLLSLDPQDGDRIVYVHPPGRYPEGEDMEEIRNAVGWVAEKQQVRFGPEMGIEEDAQAVTERWRVVRRRTV